MRTLLLLSCLSGPLPQAEQALTNSGIVELVRAGLPDETLVKLIESRDGAFDVSVQGLIELKKAGLSNRVIKTILGVSTRTRPAGANEALSPLLPDEQGVYWVGDQGLQRLPAENVTLRGPGPHHNDTGAIQAARSRMRLTPPLTFVVRAPDNVSADEYLLLQLFIRRDRREFRTLEGGLWRTDSSDRMAVPFASERLAPNIFRVRVVALPKGEFGFLRPGGRLGPGPTTEKLGVASGAGLASAGTVFTFGVN